MAFSPRDRQQRRRIAVEGTQIADRSPRRRRIATFFAVFSLVASGVLLGSLLVEFGLRWLAPAPNDFQVWPPYTRIIFNPDPAVTPGVVGPSLFEANSRGLRADEARPSNTFRVLTLGGSTTECIVLDQREAWPRMVQDQLSEVWQDSSVWVGNAGMSGHGTREHVFQAERLLDQYPRTDLVVLLLGVNDMGLRLQQDTEYDPHYLERPNVEDEMIPRAFTLYPREFREALPWFKRLEIYSRLRLARNFVVMRLLRHGAWQDPSGSSLVRWRENRRNAVRLRPQLPTMTEGLGEYRRNLTRIVTTVHSAGAEVLLMTQPSMWRSDLTAAELELLWWGGVGPNFMDEGARSEYYSVEALAEGIRLYNETLLEQCAVLGALCFDLAARLPKDTSVFYDGVHFNEGGAALVAELVADFIVQAGR